MLIMNSKDDDLTSTNVSGKLETELRQRYRLAENRFGNRIIEKIIQQSDGSLSKARTILPQYMKRMKGVYPELYEELIILKFMDDEGSENDATLNSTNQILRTVPQVIAYMKRTRYRPRLN